MSQDPYESPPPPVSPQPGAPFEEGVVETNPEARNWAMFAHLASLIGLTGIPYATIGGPLVVWLLKKDEFPFVNDQGKEALNFQITMAIALTISAILVLCAGLGIIGLIVFGIVDVVFAIIAGITAASGKAYRYPMTIRLVK